MLRPARPSRTGEDGRDWLAARGQPCGELDEPSPLYAPGGIAR